MATITVRDLPDDVQRRLKQRAVANHRSMEAEARAILSAAVAAKGFGAAWLTLAASYRGEPELPERTQPRHVSELQELRRSAGAPLSVEDGMIAAICSSRSLTLATRNIRDFEGLGIGLVDPWAARLT